MGSGAAASPSIEEAIGRALRLQQLGQLAEADAIYRAVLARNPRNAHALHFLGLLCHERGATVEGMGLLERAVEVAPSDLDARNNLGSLYIFAGKLSDAEATFRALLVTAPTFSSARFNLGVLLARSQRLDEAILELQAVVLVAPEAETYRELGDALRAKDRFEEAVAAYREALARSPSDPDLKKRLCRSYFLLVDAFDRNLTDPASAVVHLERWLELDPDDPIARHTLAAYSGRGVPERCSDGYIRRTFDLFADSFDDVLGKIGYAGVTSSAAALASALGSGGRSNAPAAVVLDAGSGTGALGPLIRSACARLVGIDLSSKMVEKTRARGCYDEVEEVEIVDYLGRHQGEFDAIVCADTVIYFGDVSGLFGAAMSALKPGGHFVFTVEGIEVGTGEATFHLDRHGRYSHAEPYLTRTIEASGGTVERIERMAAIRVEYGSNVPGMTITAIRNAASVS